MYAITPNLASHSQPHRVSRKEMARTSEPRRGARTETSSINRYETVGKCTSAKAHTYSYGSPKQQSFQGWWLVVAVAVEGFEVEIAKKTPQDDVVDNGSIAFYARSLPMWTDAGIVCVCTHKEKSNKGMEKSPSGDGNKSMCCGVYSVCNVRHIIIYQE